MADEKEPQVTRKPHYVPAGYLQFFSVEPKGRKSMVYLYDGTKSVEVTVESQCFERGFYSPDAARANKAETIFQDTFEGSYPPIARKIIEGEELSQEERIDLFRFMLHINLRGPTYDNIASTDRLESFEAAYNSLVIAICRFTDHQLLNTEACIEAVRTAYDVRVFQTSSPQIMLTSDNPCVIYNYQGTGGLTNIASILILPVSPHHVAIAVDNRLFQFTSYRLTPKDAATISIEVTHNRVQNLYCHGDLSQIAHGPLPSPGTRGDGRFTDQVIEVRFGNYDGEFSFLEPLHHHALPTGLSQGHPVLVQTLARLISGLRYHNPGNGFPISVRGLPLVIDHDPFLTALNEKHKLGEARWP